MHSVLIVDDEPTIREGLTALIEWERLGYVVVDTASNAKEAIAKYRLRKPDLLIVDIRMPGMDGLELVQLLKRDNERLHILVLSGYADFSYAKRAIGLGIDGYLLKPVDEDEMTEYLVKLKGSLDEKRRSTLHRSGSADFWNRDLLVQAVLTDRFAGDGDELQRAAAEAGLIWSGYQVVLLLPLPDDTGSQPSTAAIQSGLASLYERNGRGIVFTAEPYIGLMLRHGLTSGTANRELLADIQKAAEAEHCTFAAVAGDRITRLEDVGSSYATALERMRQRFFYDVSGVIGPDSMQPFLPAENPDPEAVSGLDGLTDKFVFATDIGNAESVPRLLEEAGKLMLLAGEGEWGIKTRFVQILTNVFDKLSLTHASIRERSQSYAKRVLAIEKSPSYAEMLNDIAALLAEAARGIGGDTPETRIRRMIDMIHRNYKENLKLESIAELLNYNSAYLGKLFKNATGDYFNTYLDKVRIEKAKELLDQGMRVYEVAEQVGFANVDYFHGKFRKYVGTSPTAYRKK